MFIFKLAEFVFAVLLGIYICSNSTGMIQVCGGWIIVHGIMKLIEAVLKLKE